MSKFTPGPWKWSADWSRLESGDDAIIWPSNAVIQNPRDAREALGSFGDRCEDQAEANARLIAAAPDMLAALEETIEFLDWPTSPREARELSDRLLAIIKRAKGEL